MNEIDKLKIEIIEIKTIIEYNQEKIDDISDYWTDSVDGSRNGIQFREEANELIDEKNRAKERLDYLEESLNRAIRNAYSKPFEEHVIDVETQVRMNEMLDINRGCLAVRPSSGYGLVEESRNIRYKEYNDYLNEVT